MFLNQNYINFVIFNERMQFHLLIHRRQTINIKGSYTQEKKEKKKKNYLHLSLVNDTVIGSSSICTSFWLLLVARPLNRPSLTS